MPGRTSARAEKQVKDLLDKVWAIEGGWVELLSIIDNRSLRAALVEARMKNGLTQADVAERLGTTQGSVSEFETCRYPNPTLSTLRRYAMAVGVILNPHLEHVYRSDEDEEAAQPGTPNQEE